MNFAVPADHTVKPKESENVDKYLHLACGLKTLKHEIDVYTNCNLCFWYNQQRIDKGTGGLGRKRMSVDPPSYHIIEISRTTENSPGDLSRLATTQIPVKDHQLTLMGNNVKE